MATYYVSPHGSDSNNGLGPDASHATNKPWLTLSKALGSSGIASGDTVYVAPGTYRETVTITMTNPTVETRVIGDVANSQAFRTSGGVLLDGGDVVLTAYTSGDTSAPAAANLINSNGRDYLTFQFLTCIGGTASVSGIALVTGRNLTVEDCTILLADGATNAIYISGTASTTTTARIRRCRIWTSRGIGIQVQLPTNSTADFNHDVIIQNCIIESALSNGVFINPSGALSFKPGGIQVLHCLIRAATTAVIVNNANGSTTYPTQVYYSSVLGATTGLSANTSGQITEDYNYIGASTARTNVTAGSNSRTGNATAPLFEIGQSYTIGSMPRHPYTPLASSPLLALVPPGASPTPPTVDLLNRTRPAGSSSLNGAFGPLERHDTAARETSVVRTGSVALRLAGPSAQSFQVAVDAVQTTIAVYGRYDTNHGTTTKPQLSIVNGGECGVPDATATMTAAANTWEQISLTFTPARAGIITVRLRSRPSAGNGIAYFDDITVT